MYMITIARMMYPNTWEIIQTWSIAETGKIVQTSEICQHVLSFNIQQQKCVNTFCHSTSEMCQHVLSFNMVNFQSKFDKKQMRKQQKNTRNEVHHVSPDFHTTDRSISFIIKYIIILENNTSYVKVTTT